MLYDIINPSDRYTIECSSLDVAVMASVLLGQGNYGLRSLDGGQDVPMFSFGGGDEWCRKHCGEDLMSLSNRVMDEKLSEIADSLDSVLYGDKQDRVEFLESTKGMDRANFMAERIMRQDARRSSTNDIGERAYRMAAKLRKAIENGSTTQ